MFTRWLLSINAKYIDLNGLMYLIFIALLGTGISVLIRLELSAPGSQFLAGNHQLFNVIITAYALITLFLLFYTFIKRQKYLLILYNVNLRYPFTKLLEKLELFIYYLYYCFLRSPHYIGIGLIYSINALTLIKTGSINTREIANLFDNLVLSDSDESANVENYSRCDTYLSPGSDSVISLETRRLSLLSSRNSESEIVDKHMLLTKYLPNFLNENRDERRIYFSRSSNVNTFLPIINDCLIPPCHVEQVWAKYFSICHGNLHQYYKVWEPINKDPNDLSICLEHHEALVLNRMQYLNEKKYLLSDKQILSWIFYGIRFFVSEPYVIKVILPKVFIGRSPEELLTMIHDVYSEISYMDAAYYEFLTNLANKGYLISNTDLILTNSLNYKNIQF